MAQPFSEAEIADFLAQLDGFRGTLSSRQRLILDALLEAAAVGDRDVGIDPDVEGFAWRPQQEWPVEPKRVARVIQRTADRP
jgi:hypothetical protein